MALPDPHDFSSRFAADQSDLTVAILGASYLDALLEDLLRTYLVQSGEAKELFGQTFEEGPDRFRPWARQPRHSGRPGSHRGRTELFRASRPRRIGFVQRSRDGRGLRPAVVGAAGEGTRKSRVP